MMNVIAYEISYFETRVQHSGEMAAACTSLCGRRSHLALMDLYVLKVEELQAIYHAGSLTRETAPSDQFTPLNTGVLVERPLPATTTFKGTFVRKSGTLSMVMA